MSEDDDLYAKAQVGLALARQQVDMLGRYQEGQRLMAERQWDQANALLQGLLQDVDNYQDVSELLQTIRMERAQEESLQRFYDYAQDALQTAQWERAYDLLQRIHELRPDFLDVGTLLAQQKRLHGLYDQAIEAMSDRRWGEAQALLRQLEALEPRYKNLASLVARTERELETEAQVSSWYSEAKSYIALEEWEHALELLDQVQDLHQGYRDTLDLIAHVQAKILLPCPRCGVMTPSGHRFCGKCGAPILSWICWRCQTPVPTARKFCGKCGAPRTQPATVVCPQCGTENPRGRKFCGRCGLTLPQK